VINGFWESLGQKFGRGGRFGVVTGAVIILLITAFSGYYLLRPDYQVLFAEVTPQDTAAMTAELDRLKIPYILADQGGDTATILVERSEVYKTRIKLMGKDIPLHGAVGFELFNNSDFGMTEFAQKVNYQRALQGELIRTILSLTAIRDARVLLVLPEQGLLKQANNKPKASVTLTMKQGEQLRAEQVAGIQRLVSSAVPGIVTEDVTIVDQNGVALTRVTGEPAGTEKDKASDRLDLKRDTEAYLSRKAGEVLDHVLGPGQAMASVDVTLDMDRVQSSTDEVLGAPGKAGEAPTGVVVRERETKPELTEPLGPRAYTAAAGAGPAGDSSQREVEYAVSRRAEQVVSQPGSIRRVQAAVVVRGTLTAVQQEQLRKTVAASVGASMERGDTVVLQSLDETHLTEPTVAAPPAAMIVEKRDQPVPEVASIAAGYPGFANLDKLWSIEPVMVGGGIFLACAVFIVAMGLFSRRRLVDEAGYSQSRSLSRAQREIALEQVRSWMEGGRSVTGQPDANRIANAPSAIGSSPRGRGEIV
jgi:flagellar M-ring protein FliF